MTFINSFIDIPFTILLYGNIVADIILVKDFLFSRKAFMLKSDFFYETVKFDFRMNNENTDFFGALILQKEYGKNCTGGYDIENVHLAKQGSQ